MRQSAAYINLEIYEEGVRRLGIASVKLPDITYPVVTIAGAGMMGNIEVPLYGMVDTMTAEITWLEPTGDAVVLASPEKHQIECRVASEKWEVEAAEVAVQADRYVMIVQPKTFAPGNIAPMGSADTNTQYAVYYFAGYKDNVLIWEIDKRNMKCVINGTDYMAPVKVALGM